MKIVLLIFIDPVIYVKLVYDFLRIINLCMIFINVIIISYEHVVRLRDLKKENVFVNLGSKVNEVTTKLILL